MTLLGMTLLMVKVQLASVGGTVTKPGGNEPLPGAQVQLSPVSALPGEQAIRSVVAQDDGRFVIEGVEPGDYRLTVESARYGTLSYGQRLPDGPGAVLSLSAGQQVTGLRLSMIPTGTIAGRVTGRNGQPAVNASVQALRYSYRGGRKALVTAQVTSTDDRGEYRLFWLPPGRYIVAANLNANVIYGGLNLGLLPGRNLRPGGSTISAPDSPPPELLIGEFLVSATAVTRILEDGTQQEETWVPTYYPSATDPRMATPVDVSGGATFNGVNFAIGPSRAHRVRGNVTGFNPGSMPTVTLQPQDLVGAIIGKGASATDGSFGFSGVLPGVYYLTARDTRTGLASAPITVSVENRDVEGLVIGMTPGVRVEGRVTLDGPLREAAALADLSGLVIWVQPDLPGFAGQPANQVLPTDGSFVLNLPQGNYVLSVNTTTNRQAGTPPLYLKSMRFAGADAMDGVRVTASPDSRVEIVLTTETGTVEGAIRDTRGVAVPGATAVLVPDSGRKQSDRYKFATVGADGAFRFSGVVPGNYKLFAWNAVETGAWQDPDFLRPFESKGRAVIVSGNAQSVVQLEVLDAQ